MYFYKKGDLLPEFTPDWEYWKRLSIANENELVLLAIGVNPSINIEKEILKGLSDFCMIEDYYDQSFHFKASDYVSTIIPFYGEIIGINKLKDIAKLEKELRLLRESRKEYDYDKLLKLKGLELKVSYSVCKLKAILKNDIEGGLVETVGRSNGVCKLKLSTFVGWLKKKIFLILVS